MKAKTPKKSKKPLKKKTIKIVNNLIETKDVKLPTFTVEKVVTTFSQTEGWGIKQLNVPETWKITRGEGVTIMVIDTGYTDHPDVASGILKGKCKSFLSYEPEIDDKNGHSTHCLGIVGARDNEEGMVGVAPACNLIACKVLGSDGSGSMNAVAEALEYAVQIKPDVVSMSLGSPEGTDRIHNAIKELYRLNIPVVAAAGNSGQANDVNYPGKYPETICVTAYGEDGKPANFNSTGSEVGISAPGVNIYSTWLNRSYAKLSGTSMATPFCAGVVALLIAKHRKQEKDTGLNDCKTVDQIKEHLSKYSDDKGIIGKDDTWGYGMIDPVRLITEDSTTTTPVTSSLPAVPPVKEKKKKKSWWRRLLGL